MINENQIKIWAEEALEGTDRFVVDVLIRNGDVIFIFLDSDSTLSIDHCVEVSRFIEGKLDRDEQDYELRVSSSGLDQPLTSLRQIKKNKGRSLEIELNDGTMLKAKLIEVVNNDLVLETFTTKKQSKIKKTEIGDRISMPYDQVKEVKIIISFK